MQKEILTGIIVVSAIIMCVSILMQKQEGGLGSTFGGSDSGSYMKKRGAEKIIFYLTIISAIIFIGTILLTFVLK